MFKKNQFPRRRPHIKGMSINHLIPNIITLLSLTAGLTAIRFAFDSEWQSAVVAILLAGVLDGLDGRVARLLRGTSKFGAELDSLSDFVCFGVAPALLVYQWCLHKLDVFGWAIVLLFVICCALRLARFNTMINDNLPSYAGNFFMGTPAPASAGLVMFPIVLSFEGNIALFTNENYSLIEPWIVAGLLLLISVLMVSNIPTFSFKKVRIPHIWVLPLLLVVGLFAAFLVFEPWWSLSALATFYLLSIPFSIHGYCRLKKAMEKDDNDKSQETSSSTQSE